MLQCQSDITLRGFSILCHFSFKEPDHQHSLMIKGCFHEEDIRMDLRIKEIQWKNLFLYYFVLEVVN